MTKRFEIERHGSYDALIALRPPGLLIGSLIFLCRSLVAVVAFGIAGAPGVRAAVGSVDTEGLWIGCLAALPALLVLYAVGARVPKAPAFVRWTWAHGRALMSLSALCHIALAVTLYWSDPRRWHIGSPMGKAMVVTDVAIIGYVFLSPRVRHTFLDFPLKEVVGSPRPT
jgi:hypothetical protein